MSVNLSALFVSDLSAYITGERRLVRLAPFYDALVVAGYSTSNDDARRVLADTGAYAAGISGVTEGAGTKNKDGSKNSHGLAMQRVSQGIRAAIKRAEGTENAEEDSDETTEAPKNLLTRAGLAATLAEVTAAWTAAQV